MISNRFKRLAFASCASTFLVAVGAVTVVAQTNEGQGTASPTPSESPSASPAATSSPVAGVAATPENYSATLSDTNNSGASGTARFVVQSDTVGVIIEGQGLAVGEHKQYIYSGTRCPTAADDKNGDGYIDSVEVAEVVGNPVLPLTLNLTGSTSQTTGPFPVASQNGTLLYAGSAPITTFEQALGQVQATPAASPSASPSESPSATPSESPTASPSELPSASPSESPSASPSASASPVAAGQLSQLNGHVVIIQGADPAQALPETVASGDPAAPPAQSLAVACGVIQTAQ